MKIVFFEIKEDWQKKALLEKLGSHELLFFSESLTNLSEVPKDTEVLGVFVNSKVTKEVINDLKNLKLIVTFSTGFDHIDIEAASHRKVTVCNVPAYGENTVAEFTFGLILTLSRKIYPAIKRVHDEGKFAYEGLRGFDLKDKTIGVIGTGKIGKHVIRIAEGFEMKVTAFDPHPDAELEDHYGVKYLPLTDLLSSADIITIHVPYMPATHHLINQENLKLVKSSAVLINTSRGGLVDTMALLTALKNKQLAGASLDVLEEEGFVIDELNLLEGHPNEKQLKTVLANHELMQMDNVIVTPHNAFNTQEALERIVNTSAENIKKFLEGDSQNSVKVS